MDQMKGCWMRLCQLHTWLPPWTVSKASRQSTSLLSRAKQQLLCPHCSRKQNSIMHNSVISWKVISANMLVRTSVKCIVNRTNGLEVIIFCWKFSQILSRFLFDWIQSGFGLLQAWFYLNSFPHGKLRNSWNFMMTTNLLGTNISHFKGTLFKMIFLLPRWDLLIPWWVTSSPS